MDHPRSRGVYPSSTGPSSRRPGSSPLARGLRGRWYRRLGAHGIIPARAGFTGPHRPGGGAPADHPRSRGVYRVKAARSRGGVGSSPLARGLPRGPPTPSPWARIIPARAGFTLPSPTEYLYLWDHPRSRGVYVSRGSTQWASGGSSPLARGLRLHRRHRRAGGRDHPRSRGVYARARPFPSLRPRIIPARAGFTTPHRTERCAPWDHPRSRGVYTSSSPPLRTTSGSSPLARGLLDPADDNRLDHGIIPARAGFTHLVRLHGRRGTDHPRSRGVYAIEGWPMEISSGSSPLARGLRRIGGPTRGSAKSVAGCLMFGVFGVLTGVRRGPAGTIGGV